MIISKTPIRISFLGGGTDYPDYFLHHGGMTLATSIDKYSYVTVKELRDLFDYKIRIGYSKTELVGSVEEIQHPAVKACLQFMEIPEGIEIHYIGDLPARTGLGSSSSFTVGLLHSLHAYKGELVKETQLAREAVYVEQKIIKERVGCQDQYCCALGGLRRFHFKTDGSVYGEPIPILPQRLEALQQRLLLFYTGIRRYANDVLEEQLDRTKNGDIIDNLKTLGALVPQAVEILTDNKDLRLFGELLHHGWQLKRTFSNGISNSVIDECYKKARAAGALGGKLLGAGGGGFILFYVEPKAAYNLRRALYDMVEVPFCFEKQGTRLHFYNV